METTWKVGNYTDGSYIITFELFKVTIAKGEIEKITSPVNTTQIDNIEGVMQMTRKDKVTNFIFNNGGKCKLGDLMKSLNALNANLRNNNTDEYLRMEDLNKKFIYSCYLNLNNGLMYKISSNCMIGRASKTMSRDLFSGVKYPYYFKGEYYAEDVKWDIKDGNPRVKYNEALFESDDIKNFNFELKTE